MASSPPVDLQWMIVPLKKTDTVDVGKVFSEFIKVQFGKSMDLKLDDSCR